MRAGRFSIYVPGNTKDTPGRNPVGMFIPCTQAILGRARNAPVLFGLNLISFPSFSMGFWTDGLIAC